MKMVLAALDFSGVTRGDVDEAAQFPLVIDGHVVSLHLVVVVVPAPRKQENASSRGPRIVREKLEEPRMEPPFRHENDPRRD